MDCVSLGGFVFLKTQQIQPRVKSQMCSPSMSISQSTVVQLHSNWGEKLELYQACTSWWSNIQVKLDHLPRNRGINKKCFKPPPNVYVYIFLPADRPSKSPGMRIGWCQPPVPRRTYRSGAGPSWFSGWHGNREVTLLETNIVPDIRPSSKGHASSNHAFSGAMLVSRRLFCPKTAGTWE